MLLTKIVDNIPVNNDLGHAEYHHGYVLMENGKTLSQTIADQLAEEIVLGKILPGTRMDEQSIATRFGVSRSPVRDALRQLAVTRLVHHMPRRGFSAMAIKSTELDSLFEAAGEIEALCAKMCALRASAAERRRIEMVHEQAQQAVIKGDAKEYSKLNDELHKLIYAGSHNQILQELALSMRQRLAPFRAHGFFVSDNRIEKSNKEHDELICAIMAQDSESASRAMYRHAANSATNVLQHFEDPEQPTTARARGKPQN